jgi:hypothetical protein
MGSIHRDRDRPRRGVLLSLPIQIALLCRR